MALLMRRHLMSVVDQLRTEPTTRRVRVLLGEHVLADTTDARLVWEPRRIVPVYAVPEAGLDAELSPAEQVSADLVGMPPVLGPERFEVHTTPGTPLTVQAAGQQRVGAAFRPDDPELAGLVLLEFAAFDWLEEDEPVIGHPHDPFKRIDTLRSDRRVVVSLAGTVLADTTRAVALLETHLPTRWYIPSSDVRMDLLEPSDLRTVCAYKGRASYLSVTGAGEAGRDVAWTYPEPLHDALSVRGMTCFYAERTDLAVDGEPVSRPVTPWSSPQEQRARFGQDAASVDFG